MTIDEAIEHAEERACGNDQCAKDHAQLADWLRELRRARMEIDLLKTLRDGFKADAQRYKTENAKLRELLLDAWTLLAFSGNDDLVAEIRKNGKTIKTIDTDEILEAMRELGIEVDV